MPFAVSKSFDVWQEGLLSGSFHEDCWPTALPAAQLPPAPKDLALLDDLLTDDPAVCALDTANRTRLRASVLAIERRVPFLSSSGRVLPAPHRLLLAVEMAKVLRAHGRDDLARLASVVAYPGVTKLRRGHQELGALLMRGPYRLLPVIEVIDGGATLLLEVAGHGGHGLKHLRRALRRVVDDGQVWRARIAPGSSLPDHEEEFACFADRGRAVFADSLTQLRRDPAVGRALARASVDLGPYIERRVDACEQLRAMTAALAVPAQGSIHLPWSTQLACHTTTGHDPMIHELAHLVDFAHGGIDGVPSTVVAPRWQAAWDEREADDRAFLGSYARTSPAELLAVATEAFFTDAAAVRRHSPVLAQLLEDTWGWVPAPRPRRSTWWVARRLLFSRMGGHFD